MATLASVLTDYEDNADYDTDNSTTKAKAFIAAARKLLVKLAREQQMGGASGERIAFNVSLVREAMQDAQEWLVGQDSAVRYFDISGLLK
jgi:hypothetical protein